MQKILGAIALGAALAALLFTPMKASARGCGDDKQFARCGGAAATPPVQLDKFMDTWQPAAAAKSSGKRTQTARQSRHRGESRKIASKRKGTAETKVAAKKTTAQIRTAAAEPVPMRAPVRLAAAEPEKTVETDGVAVTSYSEVNEIDQAAKRIEVVAFNEVNEIDLAAPPQPAAETVSQAFVMPPEPADISWIGKLLLAIAGTIALAGGVRFLVA